MAYLHNRTVNLLNLHYGLHALVINGAGVFFAVYLLRVGVPVWAVFGAIALTVAFRFALRPLVLLLAPRFGLRPPVAFGTVLTGAQYPLLAGIHGIDLMLLAFCLVAAAGEIFYWTCYHAYFAALGDAEHRGHQIGAREAIASATSIAGPVLGAWALVTLGPLAAFGAAAGLQALAALPFLGTPDVAVARTAPGAFRAALPSILLFAADGWMVAGFVFAWQIALFLSLGESFTAFGWAMALAAIIGAIAGLILGRHIDAGFGGRAVWLATASVATVTLIRAASTEAANAAVIANALGALAACVYIPTLMTAVYNQAKRSPCVLRFHVATEGGWDIGCAAGCFVAALLSIFAVPLPAAILSTFLGLMLFLAVLRRYYAGIPFLTAIV